MQHQIRRTGDLTHNRRVASVPNLLGHIELGREERAYLDGLLDQLHQVEDAKGLGDRHLVVPSLRHNINRE